MIQSAEGALDEMNTLLNKARELALHAARIASDKGGLELAVYELPAGDATLFDYAVLVSGRSSRQVHAIVDEVLHFCKRHSIDHFPLEGEGDWQLLDCFDVIVHALSDELRDFYRLDRLWPHAKRIDHEREIADLPELESPAAKAG